MSIKNLSVFKNLKSDSYAFDKCEFKGDILSSLPEDVKKLQLISCDTSRLNLSSMKDLDEVIVPNPNNVGIGLPFEKNKLTTAYAPDNFLFTRTYGIAPSNTTLIVRYLTGGGVADNVFANSLTTLTADTKFLNSNFIFSDSVLLIYTL